MSDKDQPSNGTRHGLGTDDTDSTRNRLLDRRDYLKLTGATAAAAAAGVGATGTAAAEEYDTITVGAGETKKYVLRDGDTLENKLFDISADKAYVRVRAKGSGWKIRNIGFRGLFDCRDRDRGEMFSVDVPDENGHGLIENVYFGDKSTIGYGTPIFVGINHVGTLTIRNGYFRHWAGHAVYGAAPGRSAPSDGGGGGGEVHIENCYARNNNLDNFRIGTDGSYVKDSVVHVDDDVAPGYNDPTKVNARGIWVKEGGHCTIKNCDILLEHPDASYCIWEGDKEEEGLARVRDCQLVARDGADGLYHGNVDHQNVGHNPDVSVPSGVPTSPKQAAKGGGHVGNPPNLDGPKNDISFSGGGDGTFDYYFRATGSVEGKHGIGGEDDVDGDSGDGSTVGTGTDTYLFERDVAGMSLNLDGYLKVHLNRSDGTVTFSGTDDGNTYGYYLEVTGDIYPTDSSDDHDVEADPNGDSVNGLVGSGSDKWQYTGELSHIGLDAGTATVDVTRRHKLEIEDYDDGKTGDYDFTVSGSVKKGSKANSGDSASGHSASGAVTGGTDSYIYTGRITDFNHSGAIHTYIDDVEVITPSLGHNTVTFEGSGSSKSYSFKVVGGLGKSAVGDSSINSGDDVSGRTASGAVSSGDDSYDYRDGVLAVDNKWKGLTPEFSTN